MQYSDSYENYILCCATLNSVYLPNNDIDASDFTWHSFFNGQPRRVQEEIQSATAKVRIWLEICSWSQPKNILYFEEYLKELQPNFSWEGPTSMDVANLKVISKRPAIAKQIAIYLAEEE